MQGELSKNTQETKLSEYVPLECIRVPPIGQTLGYCLPLTVALQSCRGLSVRFLSRPRMAVINAIDAVHVAVRRVDMQLRESKFSEVRMQLCPNASRDVDLIELQLHVRDHPVWTETVSTSCCHSWLKCCTSDSNPEFQRRLAETAPSAQRPYCNELRHQHEHTHA